jgi:hypothetical protein
LVAAVLVEVAGGLIAALRRSFPFSLADAVREPICGRGLAVTSPLLLLAAHS